MNNQAFNDLTEVYEALVDWPKRLAHETPFYRTWFERCTAGRVLDCACGTGHHAALFASWGLAVEGADISPNMIARARRTHGESDRLRWTVRGFEQPHPDQQTFDVALCAGNSLALAADVSMAERTVVNLIQAVRPGGVAIVHLLNLWHLPDGPCIWQKRQQVELQQRPTLILKGVQRSGNRGFVNVVVLPLESPAIHSESVPLLGIEQDALQQMALRAGAKDIQFFGDYREQPYDRARSTDLIMVAIAGE